MYIENGQVYSSLSLKQANVIFRNAKVGNIKLMKFQIEKIYEYAKGYGMSIYQKNDIDLNEDRLFKAIELLFKNEFKEAQYLIYKSFNPSRYSKAYLKENGRTTIIA